MPVLLKPYHTLCPCQPCPPLQLCTHVYTWTTLPIVHFADVGRAAIESPLVQFQVPLWHPICLNRRLEGREEVWGPSELLDKAYSSYLCNPRLTATTIKQLFKELHHLVLQPFRDFPSTNCPFLPHTHTLELVVMGMNFEKLTILLASLRKFLLASWCGLKKKTRLALRKPAYLI